ncbi:MAG: thiamine-phosphate kinase [Pseudomonadota bacterium]
MSDKKRVKPTEFDLIRSYFAPLTANAPGAFELKDDAALLDEGAYVVTKDVIIAGVHFLEKDPIDLVARKLLRVNLSDLAAKGAKPLGYFLACVWPQGTKPDAVALFAQGLKEDQEHFSISLYGGDTCMHRIKSGPLTLSATFFGAPPRAGLTARSGARAGDDVYVSGVIGDAGLGLRALQRKGKFAAADKAPLIYRYQLPTPRLTLGGALTNVATAAIDVSDGLLADAAHIAAASDLRIEIEAGAIPLSAAAQRWLASARDEESAVTELATFGDDYEILFTAPPQLRRSVSVAAEASRTDVSRIGVVKRGEGAALIGEGGDVLETPASGFDHFSTDED